MSNTRPTLRGYPIDTRMRDHRPVTTPWRTTVGDWLRRRPADA